MGGLEENPFKKNNGLIANAPIGNDSKPLGQLSTHIVMSDPLAGKPNGLLSNNLSSRGMQNGLTDLPINRIKL